MASSQHCILVSSNQASEQKKKKLSPPSTHATNASQALSLRLKIEEGRTITIDSILIIKYRTRQSQRQSQTLDKVGIKPQTRKGFPQTFPPNFDLVSCTELLPTARLRGLSSNLRPQRLIDKLTKEGLFWIMRMQIMRFWYEQQRAEYFLYRSQSQFYPRHKTRLLRLNKSGPGEARDWSGLKRDIDLQRQYRRFQDRSYPFPHESSGQQARYLNNPPGNLPFELHQCIWPRILATDHNRDLRQSLQSRNWTWRRCSRFCSCNPSK